MSKPARIIDYQNDKQRTPTEALEFLKDEIDAGKFTHMLVVYSSDKILGYVAASEDRDYTSPAMLWDFEQWKRWWLGEPE